VASTLNPSQQAAVEHDLGPMLVLAGAGSGKTRVVTMRIARLLERGVAARNILAMTFTNKAAGEMAERVTKLVGAKASKDLTAGTFHRFGLDVLRAEARALGLRGGKFTVFDQADCSGVVREVLREVRAGKGYDVGAIVARISAAKNAFIEPDAYMAQLAASGLEPSEYDEITGLVYPKYVSMMRGFYAFDFDDLICEVVSLFKRREEIREKYRMRFRYLIVDEYQDTNRAQLELVLALGGGHKNVCVVGDDDQSIYAWRGADVRNILEFERYFEGAKIVKLEHNYRSSEAILKVASVVLEKSVARRHAKTIVSTRPGGEPVEMVVCVDAEAEAKFVARTIDDLVRTGKARPKDCAILYRSNLQAPELETALKERQIDYDMIGGTQLFERKEVKDLLSYLKVVFDPMDEIALRRIVNYPSRGIGEVALEKIASHATAYKTTLWTALTRAHAVQDLAPAAMEGARDVVRVIESARASFNQGKVSTDVARELLDAVRLKEDLTAASSSHTAAARRWSNLEGILGVFSRRDARGLGTGDAFEDFLRLLALRQDSDDAKPADAVTLSTMHGAKGLEFPYVFIVGLEEGLLPHSRTESERVTDVPVGEHGVDEERRLFYVSVTRAKDKLYLCRAGRRAFRGKSMSRMPSRYVVEIPHDLYTLREDGGEDPQAAVVQRAGAQNLLAALAALGPPK